MCNFHSFYTTFCTCNVYNKNKKILTITTKFTYINVNGKKRKKKMLSCFPFFPPFFLIHTRTHTRARARAPTLSFHRLVPKLHRLFIKISFPRRTRRMARIFDS